MAIPVKLGYNRCSAITHFFLVPAEFLLISIGDVTVVTTDSFTLLELTFRLVQTSFAVLILQTVLDTTASLGQDLKNARQIWRQVNHSQEVSIYPVCQTE